MSSQKRNLVIAIGIIAILAVAYFVAISIGEKKDDASQGKTVLISQPDFEATEVTIDTQSVDATYVKEGINWVVKGNEAIDLVQISIDRMLAYAKNLTYISIVAEDLAQAEQFGLLNANIVTLKDAQGNTIEIKVGDRTVDGTGYYVAVGGDEKIYIVDADSGAALKKSPDDMRDRLPEFVNYDNSEYIAIERNDRLSFVIEPNQGTVPAVGYGEYVISGYYEEATLLLTENLRDSIGAPINNIYAVTFIDKAEELSAYGLDNPFMTISAKDFDGNTCVIEVGNETQEGNYYAKFSNKPYICTIDGSNFERIANARMVDIIGKFFVPIDHNAIRHIEISQEGTTKAINLDFENNVAKINNQDVEAEEIMGFVKYLIILTRDGEINKQVGTENIGTVIVTDTQAQKYQLDFFAYDENFYAVEFNGTMEFITGKKDVDSMFGQLLN